MTYCEFLIFSAYALPGKPNWFLDYSKCLNFIATAIFSRAFWKGHYSSNTDTIRSDYEKVKNGFINITIFPFFCCLVARYTPVNCTWQ